MKNRNLLILIGLLVAGSLLAQVNYSANDQIAPYTGKYLAGVNPGYYGGNWTNFELTDLAAGNAAVNIPGAGVQAIRGTLPEHYGIIWDYNNWIPVYEYYAALGIKDNTLVVGVAHPDHRDPVDYCPSDPVETTMFANLYEPIWDGGANGTAINENNYMAKYVYDLVTTVGDHVKFWEVWNEPGFDLSGYKSSLQPGQPGNWYENDPDPCDIILRAPIQHYIRTLRITYEVVKTYSPDDYIVLSGIGTDAFLDALMRNTDNPNGGQVTPEYPLKAGAYFDVVGFHAYPHFDGSIRYWDNNVGGFVYSRHSDGAVEGFNGRVNQRKNLLATYGYDGATYPEKLLIVTEMDVPRLPFGEYFGSDELQKNYIMKSIANAIKIGLTQTHVWQLAERTTEANAVGSFDAMGFYSNINNLEPGQASILPQGIAHATAAGLLADATFSQVETNHLNLPNGVKGGAFQRTDGSYIYMLWARTQTDLSESANATYSFPASYGQNMNVRYWDYSQTNTTGLVSSQNIQLTGTPVFFTLPGNTGALTLNCPAGNLIEVPAPESDGGAVVNWTEPTASTTCPDGVVSVTSTGGVNGDFFPFGVTVVGYTATDHCGNTKHCATRVAVSSTGGINTTCRISLWDFKFAGQRDGHKYFISKFKKTYQEAVAVAASYGAKLLSIETQAENEFLRYQFADAGYIGLSDAQVEGNLTWESGAPVTYTNFDDCSWCLPNTSTNDFAEFHPWNGKWSFNDGTTPQFFMMEFDCGNIAPTGITITNFPTDISLIDANGLNVYWDTPTATTTCPGGQVVVTQTAGPSIGQYIAATGNPQTVTYSFTDNCGNSLSQSFTVTVSPGGGGGCPSSIAGFTTLGSFQGHKYYQSDGALSWNENKNLAQAQGGYLVSINSAAENEFIKNNISEMAHIGLNDASTEGALAWVNGEAVGYTNLSSCTWCGLNDGTHDFGILLPWDGTWAFDHQWAARKMVMEMDCFGAGSGDLTMSACPDNMSLTTTTGSVVATWDVPTATTTCPANSAVTITRTAGPPPGSIFNIGNHVISYQATDNCGHTKSCSFTISVTDAGSGGTCDAIPGFIKIGEWNGHGYYISDASVPWQQAKVLAENAGGYLATMNNQAENDFVKNHLNNAMVFIGFNDEATEGVGQWADNEPVSLDLSYSNSTENDFAVMNFWAGTWQMVSQYVYKPFLMEKNCGSSATSIDLVCPASLVVTETGNGGALVNWNPATATTTCLSDGLQILQSGGPVSGSFFAATGNPVTITYQASDACNNAASCTFTVTVNTAGGGGCATTLAGYTSLGMHNGHAYYLSDDIANWNDASALATSLGGYLAKIEDATENEFLRSHINNYTLIGLNDAANEGQLVWTDGSPLGYTQMDGSNSSENDFAVMNFWDGGWSMVNQWVAKNYLVEINCAGAQPVPQRRRNWKDQVKLYPNPASDILFVQVATADAEDMSIAIYDFYGKQLAIKSKRIAKGTSTIEFDISNFKTGMYFVRMSTGIVLRFVKD